MLELAIGSLAFLVFSVIIWVVSIRSQLSDGRSGIVELASRHKERKALDRYGFTVIELMIVITIIAVMATLVVGASYRFVVGARETATATTILKAGGIIDDRVREFRETDFTVQGRVLSGTWNNQVPPPAVKISPATGEILARKATFRHDFPQCFQECDASQKVRYWGPTATVPPTNAEYQSKYEPGIVFYALLTKGVTYGAPTPGDDAFRSAEIKNDPTTGNLPCLVDAWGEPIRFYRWPTRLIKCGENSVGDYNGDGVSTNPAGTIDLTTGLIQASPAIRPTGTLISPTPASIMMPNLPPWDITSPYSKGQDQQPGVWGATTSPNNTLGYPLSDDTDPLAADPDDPTMLLASEWFATPAYAIEFVVGSEKDPVTQTYFVNAYHDPYCYWTPLIVSAGPDRTLGIYEPNDIPTVSNPTSINFGYLGAPIIPFAMGNIYDNITNLNQKAR